jgi:hypothetical protein
VSPECSGDSPRAVEAGARELFRKNITSLSTNSYEELVLSTKGYEPEKGFGCFFFFLLLVTGPGRPLSLELSNARVYGP